MSDKGQLHDIYVDFDKPKPAMHDNGFKLQRIRPWIRFSARILDTMIFQFIFSILLVIFAPAFFDELNLSFFGIFSLFVWIFVESLLLLTWGTTPFKWLLKIQIKTKDNKKPHLFNALKRSIKVWFFGLAMGFPFICIFTLISAHSALTKNRITSWDKSEQFTITHKEIGIYRAGIAWLILGTQIWLIIWANYYT